MIERCPFEPCGLVPPHHIVGCPNDDRDDEIGSWNGQRTATADKLAGCTWWVLGFIALMFFCVVFVSPAIEAVLQW